MKHFITVLVFLNGAHSYGQNFNEWVRQRRTQIRYLVNQIGALQVYIELGHKGYAVYQDGLTVIGDIKDGEFNLHKDYFSSFSVVNPRVGSSPDVQEMLKWHREIQQINEVVRSMELGEEQASLQKVFDGVARKSDECIDQLELLITGGNYQLKDDERISQIEKVHKEMYDLYGFARSVHQEAVILRQQRGRQLKDVKTLRSLQGIK